MDVVFAELAKEYPVTQFLRVCFFLCPSGQTPIVTPAEASSSRSHLLLQVEAEELSDISEQYGVSAVPFFAIIKVGCTPASD